MKVPPSTNAEARAAQSQSTSCDSDNVSANSENCDSAVSRPAKRQQTAALRARITDQGRRNSGEQANALPLQLDITNFSDLPPELRNGVIQQCPPEEIKTLRQVNKEIKVIANSMVHHVSLDEPAIAKAAGTFTNTRSMQLIDDAMNGGPSLQSLQNLPLSKLTILAPRHLSDNDMQHLLPLRNTLQELELSGCGGVTDQGIARLAGLVNLKKLSIVTCRNITASSLDQLKAQLPELEINFIELPDQPPPVRRTKRLN